MKKEESRQKVFHRIQNFNTLTGSSPSQPSDPALWLHSSCDSFGNIPHPCNKEAFLDPGMLVPCCDMWVCVTEQDGTAVPVPCEWRQLPAERCLLQLHPAAAWAELKHCSMSIRDVKRKHISQYWWVNILLFLEITSLYDRVQNNTCLENWVFSRSFLRCWLLAMLPTEKAHLTWPQGKPVILKRLCWRGPQRPSSSHPCCGLGLQFRLSGVSPKVAWSTSRGRTPMASLDSLCWHLTTLSVKKFP